MCEEYRHMKGEMKMSVYIMYVQSIMATQNSEHLQNCEISAKNWPHDIFSQFVAQDNNQNGRP